MPLRICIPIVSCSCSRGRHSVHRLLNWLDIIHGDIKPENVLMLKREDGSLSAKVADFGYHASFGNSSNLLELPNTSPWHAPERQERSNLAPAEVMTADIFSFGMVSLWFVFEKQLLKMAQSPDHVPVSCLDYLSDPGPDRSQAIANKLRSANYLPDPAILKILAGQQSFAVQLAQTLISGRDGLDGKLGTEFKPLFEGTLALDPKEPVADLRVLLELKAPDP